MDKEFLLERFIITFVKFIVSEEEQFLFMLLSFQSITVNRKIN